MEDFEKHVMILALHFIRRKYPEELLLEAAMKARALNREDLLKPIEVTQTVDDKIIFITTFHPSDKSIQDLVRKNWNILGQSPLTEKMYQKN